MRTKKIETATAKTQWHLPYTFIKPFVVYSSAILLKTAKAAASVVNMLPTPHPHSLIHSHRKHPRRHIS